MAALEEEVGVRIVLTGGHLAHCTTGDQVLIMVELEAQCMIDTMVQLVQLMIVRGVQNTAGTAAALLFEDQELEGPQEAE